MINKQERNKSNGVTLIALIITIIIMLILAGVAMSMISIDGGLFSKTRYATEKYENEAQEEKNDVKDLLRELNKQLGIVELVANNVAPKSFTLIVTLCDDNTKIVKYEFYINNVLEKTIETSEKTATWDVTGKNGETTYTCKVIAYEDDGYYYESKELHVTTGVSAKPVEEVANSGNFVNYSVKVNDVTYNKWRILNMNNNGHVEIVCYNGPTYSHSYSQGNYVNPNAAKAYKNIIQLLNTQSQVYKNGTYGVSARHLGSNPANPNAYATIPDSLLPDNIPRVS